MHELSDSMRATITDELNLLAPYFLGGVARTATIEIVDGVDVLRLVFDLRDGKATLVERGPPEDETVGVRLDLATAIAIGRGEQRLQDAYSAGSVVVERAATDDFRLGPLLEVLFDTLVDAGAI